LVSNKTYNASVNPIGEIKIKIKNKTSTDSFIIGLVPINHKQVKEKYANNGICITSNG